MDSGVSWKRCAFLAGVEWIQDDVITLFTTDGLVRIGGSRRPSNEVGPYLFCYESMNFSSCPAQIYIFSARKQVFFLNNSAVAVLATEAKKLGDR